MARQTHHGSAFDDAVDKTFSSDPWDIYTYEGDDEVFGSELDDNIYAGADRDFVFGNDGDDYIDGGPGDDGFAVDRGLIGGHGIDTIHGGADNDEIFGFAKGSREHETTGNFLFGDSGNDTIFGDNGDDMISGGSGRDTLTSGGGADTFVFSAGDMVNIYEPLFRRSFERYEMDTVTDFANGLDRLDVSSLLDLDTKFAGTTAQQAIQQGYIYFAQHGTAGQPGFGTYVCIDRDGGAHGARSAALGGEFIIADLSGIARNQLDASDFIV